MPDPVHQDAPRSIGAILRQIGPGLILTASIVGSGEVIATPKLAAEAGFSLLWLIVLGCVIKVFVQVELGRFAVAKGMTTLEALDSMPGPRVRVSWLVWLWVFMYVGTIFQVAGIVGAVTQVLTSAGLTLNGKVLALLIGGVTAAMLVAGRYRLVERVSIVMVAGFTVCTIIAVGSLQWSDYAITSANLIDGFRFQMPENFNTAFGAFGIIGVGASELIFYPYWVLEKGYAVNVGPNDGSTAWKDRATGWMRVMQVDAWVSMVVYTVATAAFFLLGAAVLHSSGLEVNDENPMIPVLAKMYLQSFGQSSFVVFLIGAFFALFSTTFVATASNARLFADGLQIFKLRCYDGEESRQRMIKVGCVLLPAISVLAFITMGEPVKLVFIGAIAQGLMLPFLAIAALYFRHVRTDAALRPGTAWTFCLWFAAIAMMVAGGYQILTKFGILCSPK
jgi:manganese transport protein